MLSLRPVRRRLKKRNAVLAKDERKQLRKGLRRMVALQQRLQAHVDGAENGDPAGRNTSSSEEDEDLG